MRARLTPDQRKAVEHAYKGGIKVDAIAVDHGCSPALVHRIARQAGLPRRGYPDSLVAPAIREAILRDLVAGEGLARVAYKHGVASNTAARLRDAAGLPARRKRERAT